MTELILKHADQYPDMEIQDLFKLMHQSIFGCGHLVSDYGTVYESVLREWNSLDIGKSTTSCQDVFEDIGNRYVRLHLGAAKCIGLTPRIVTGLFMMSANCPESVSLDDCESTVNHLQELCDSGELRFNAAEIAEYASNWRENGYQPVRHSELYRTVYYPAYRVVNTDFIPYIPLLSRIENCIDACKKPLVIAIDGRCASGKSTLADALMTVYQASVIHMDHFFLPAHLRTTKRYAEPGGNIHYERFKDEVVNPITSDKAQPFHYGVFDCSSMTVTQSIEIVPKDIIIIEGSYSTRPEFCGIYDIKVFMDTPFVKQLSRLKVRNENMVNMFEKKWIPLEENYIAYYKVRANSDIIIKS